MDQELISQLQEITSEEWAYIHGEIPLQRDIYTQKDIFEIDSKLFLKENKLITFRTHTRFIDFPAHRHNYVEIVYVCKGSITHIIDGQEFTMKQGDLLFLNQHVMHGIRKAGEDDIAINFIALPEFFDIPLQMLKEHNVIADFLVNILRFRHPVSHYLLFQLENHRMIENLMENMISSLRDEAPNEDVINQYTMGMVFLYLINHMESLKQDSSQSYKDIVVQATLKYINTRYRTANLGKVAGDFHISVSALSKIIKLQTGFTFQDHLMRKRFQEAVRFLLETDLSADEIAINVGYENVSFFYRQFKKRYGMTPRAYRLANRQNMQIRL